MSRGRKFRASPGFGLRTPTPLTKDSGLRKLMRMARRKRIPEERLAIIETAERKAYARREVYLHSFAKRWARIRELLPGRVHHVHPQE